MFLEFNKYSKEEMRQLERFICSSYFNANAKLENLFYYLKSYYPNITDDEVKPSIIWAAATKGEKFKDTNYRKLVSDFTDLLERFFVQNEFDTDREYKKIILLRNLRKRKIKKRFDKTYVELMKEMNSQFSKDGDYYFRKSLVISEKYQNDFGKIKYEYSSLLQEQSDNIDYLILFEKLHMFHQMFQSKQNSADRNNYVQIWHDEVFRRVEKDIAAIERNHPNIYIIYLVLKMLRDNDDKIMNDLKSYLNKVGSKFPVSKLGYYYEYLTSYCVKKYNKGDIIYRKKALELYKEMDKMGIFVIDNMIIDSDFNNVVNIALAEGNLKFAEEFIEKYRKYIDEDFADSAYSLARAKLLFSKKEYDRMFELLNNVEYKDTLYYINSKFLIARAHIENKNIVSAKYIYESLKQYKRSNNKLSDDQKNTLTVFLKYFTYTLKIMDAQDSEKLKLKKIALASLEAEKQVVPTKSWFKEKFS